VPSQKSSNINRFRAACPNLVYHPYVPFSTATLNGQHGSRTRDPCGPQLGRLNLPSHAIFANWPLDRSFIQVVISSRSHSGSSWSGVALGSGAGGTPSRTALLVALLWTTLFDKFAPLDTRSMLRAYFALVFGPLAAKDKRPKRTPRPSSRGV
jgi:hypothetical protein